MHNPLTIIEDTAQAAARSLDILVYSLEGLFEKMARESPTPQGIMQYWMMAGDIVENASDIAFAKLEEGFDALKASLSDSERDFLETRYDYETFGGIAQQSFGVVLAQARIAHTKRLRDFVAARAFGTDTYTAEPKYMARNGRAWNFTEVTYLTSRQILVDFWNSVKIGYLAEQGVEEFTLLTEDPELIYTTYRVDEYPALAPELFHPRTTKLVGGAHVPT